MEGLAIEQKAKRYDEAIERVENIMTGKCETTFMFTKGLFEHIFPELAESEDEKVRRELLLDIPKVFPHDKAIRYIAYLEKQGEHAKFRDSIQVGDKVTRNQDGVLVNLSQLNRVAKKDEKKGEPTDIPADAVLDSNKDGLIADTVRYKREKQGEQKPAEISNICEFSIETWTKIVDYVLTEHNGIGNYLIDPEVKDTAEKLQKKYKFDAASEEWDRVYRKGLDAGVNKGRAEALREQKPAEWSEEDERMLGAAYDLVTTNPHYMAKKSISKENVITWLKSLKDRYSWMPSEEYIDLINEAIGFFGAHSAKGMLMMDLRNNIKKLREE